jgi:xanthosine utilization system XapX-like protein
MSIEGGVQLVDSYNEIKMLSAKSVTKEQQQLVDQVFGQMKNKQKIERVTQLKGSYKNKTRELF